MKEISNSLKFQPTKAIVDCEMVLKDDKSNFSSWYHKASAYKMLHNHHLYEITLRECIKLQPHNQIILSEYYSCRHENVPRKKRRIRMNLISSKSIKETSLSYEELEYIRLNNIYLNSSINSDNIKEQCSFILHLPEKNLLQSLNCTTMHLVEVIIQISRIMIHAEQQYQQEHKSSVLPFSYIRFCFDILIELTKVPQLDHALSMIDENYRYLLDELLSYYWSMSSIFKDVEQLNCLKNL